MKLFFRLSSLVLVASSVTGFAPSSFAGVRGQPRAMTSSSALSMSALSPGDRVLLIGPGFLQLNIAKAAKAAGLRPMIIADKKKLETFKGYVNDGELMADATYGMPEVVDPGFGEISGVVFCAEDAVLGPNVISAVLDYTDKGESIYVGGLPKRVVACAPVAGMQRKEKSMGWIPILNNDANADKVWKTFVDTYLQHPVVKSAVGSLVRYGSLLGGSVDGPELLANLGIDERFYKMSMEQFRDMRERSFDRFRLGAQVLAGNAINPQPPNQEKMEKEGLQNDEHREAFRIMGGYPQVDRANRHTVAQAVVRSLMLPTADSPTPGCVPKEMTILSKSLSELPSEAEWDEMFANPGAAKWPDPYAFDASAAGLE